MNKKYLVGAVGLLVLLLMAWGFFAGSAADAAEKAPAGVPTQSEEFAPPTVVMDVPTYIPVVINAQEIVPITVNCEWGYHVDLVDDFTVVVTCDPTPIDPPQ